MPIDHATTYILLGCIVSFAFGLVLGRRERPRPRRRRRTGSGEEARLDALLAERLDFHDYRVLHDIFLPSNSPVGSVQIDHIVVSTRGIFVIETKDWSGGIYSKDGDHSWTLTTPTANYKVPSPILQNQLHIDALAKCLNLEGRYFKSIIAFSSRSEFRKPVPPFVLHTSEVPDFITRSFVCDFVPPECLSTVVATILEWHQSLSGDFRKTHWKRCRDARKAGPFPQ